MSLKYKPSSEPLHIAVKQMFLNEAPTPEPHALHPTPYTLHPTPHTLHPTPFGQAVWRWKVFGALVSLMVLVLAVIALEPYSRTLPRALWRS
jgi:hypothetical protein